jgi:CHAT domain-containing protein
MVVVVVVAELRFGKTPPGDATRAAVDRLIAATNQQALRPTRGRLSGGFAYRPSHNGASIRPELRASYEATAAAAQLERLANLPDGSVDTAASLAIAYLVLNQPTRALEQLQDAHQDNERSGSILSDLGAAYLEVGDPEHRPEAVVLSLEASERAIRTGGSALEARFNRALALESLALVREAAAGWRAYLEVERSSEWAGEARARLKALSARSPAGSVDRLRATAATDPLDVRAVQEAVRADHDEARVFLERELLVAWAAAQSQKNGSQSFARLRVFGRALAEASGDTFFDDVSLAIARCRDVGDGRCLTATASGVNALEQGLQLSQRFEFSRAIDPLRRAIAYLNAANPPLALWATFNLIVTAYHARDLDRAAIDFGTLEGRLASRTYLHLTGRVASMRGLIDADRAAFDTAIRHYTRAQSLFRRCGEIESEINAANLLADTLRVLGDFRAAWRVRLRILTQLDRLRPQRQEALLLATARLAEAQGLFGASLNFHRAAVDLAMAVDGMAARAQVLVRRAATYAELGDAAAALADAALVEQYLSAVSDGNIRRRLEAELLVVKARLAADAGEAGAALDQALAFSREAGLVNYLPRLHLLRGRRLAAQGNADGAAAAFDHGIEELEAARLRTNATRLRVSFFDRSWTLFSEMVALQFKAGNPDRAFDYAERGRARTFSDAIAPSVSARASLMDLRDGLTTSTGLLYYVLLEDTSVVWVVGRGRAELIQLPVSSGDLNRQVRRFQRRLRAALPTQSDAERLYDVLIRPALHALPKVERLIIAPDGELNTIPFVALRRRETGRYLLQDFVVESTPNATLWLRADRRHAPATTSVTVISAPTNGQADLPALPGVVQEATSVATLYPGARHLTTRVTKVDFIGALRTDGIVHFAGHAIANVDYPELSRIVLGDPDGDAVSVVYADELATAGGFRAELVVLSACSTAVGALSRGEGPMSLARPLLVGGVRNVVGSLWDVRDTAAHELMVRFHREVSRGAPAPDALRNAQLELAADRNAALSSPSNWAAFVIFGRP